MCLTILGMGDHASRTSGRDGATVVTSQKVREGLDDDYQRWQEKTDQVVRGFEGFEGTELYPPDPHEDREDRKWVVVYRFSRVDQLSAWLDSAERRELLDEARPLFDGTPMQDVLAGGSPPRPRKSSPRSSPTRCGPAGNGISCAGRTRS